MLYQLRDLAAKKGWVSRRLRREVNTVRVASEDDMGPPRPRAQAAPTGAAPLQLG